MSVKIIALSSGHTLLKPGAYNKELSLSEGILTAKTVNEICNAFITNQPTNVEFILIPQLPLIQKVKYINRLHVDAAIEVHYNSIFKMNVQGTESLYYPDSTNGILLATIIQKHLVETLGYPDRGIKKGYYQLNPENKIDYFLRATNMPAVIIEPMFISHSSASNLKNKEYIIKIANSIYNGILDYCKEV